MKVVICNTLCLSVNELKRDRQADRYIFSQQLTLVSEPKRIFIKKIENIVEIYTVTYSID